MESTRVLMLLEENMIQPVAWPLVLSLVHCSSPQASFESRISDVAYRQRTLAGVKPAIVAGTVASGLAGIWSFVKKNV